MYPSKLFVSRLLALEGNWCILHNYLWVDSLRWRVMDGNWKCCLINWHVWCSLLFNVLLILFYCCKHWFFYPWNEMSVGRLYSCMWRKAVAHAKSHLAMGETSCFSRRTNINKRTLILFVCCDHRLRCPTLFQNRGSYLNADRLA